MSEMEEPTTSGIGALSVDLSGVASTEKSTEDTEREHRVTTWQLSKPPKATHILWSEIGWGRRMSRLLFLRTVWPVIDAMKKSKATAKAGTVF